MDFFIKYLIVINLFAVLLYFIDYLIFQRNGKGIKPNFICDIIVIGGGGLGALLISMILDPKLNKKNLLSRIYCIIWLFLYGIVLIVLYGPNKLRNIERLHSFYNEHLILCLYLAIINLVTFIAYGIDKIKAMLDKWRIREIYLLGLTIIGGSGGAILAMDLFNHKINSMHFMVGVPFILCAHLILMFCIGLGIL